MSTQPNTADLAQALAGSGPSLDPARMRATVLAYLESWHARDVEARAALFTADAVVEDPVGGPAHRGMDAVRAFWAFAESAPQRVTPRLELLVPCGSECLIRFIMRIESDATPPIEMTIHETIAFDSNSNIKHLRAFWTQDDIRPAADPNG